MGRGGGFAHCSYGALTSIRIIPTWAGARSGRIVLGTYPGALVGATGLGPVTKGPGVVVEVTAGQVV